MSVLMKKEVEGLLQKVDSKYRLCVVSAKRARQINNGSAILVQTKAQKNTTMSLEEFAFDKLKFSFDGTNTTVSKNIVAPEEKAN